MATQSKSPLPLAVKIILSILVMEILGGLGAFFTVNSISDWYATLTEPPGTPPNSIFGPVWTTLYALIGISFALVWHSEITGPERRTAFRWFWIQLILNLIWTPLFFGLHQIPAALIVIVALIISIILTIRHFRKIKPVTTWLLLPYLVWVCYATYLNAGFFVLNR